MQYIILSSVIALAIVVISFFVDKHIIKINKSKKYYSFWRGIVNQEVEDPFGNSNGLINDNKQHNEFKDERNFEAAILGNLFIDSAMSVRSLNNLLDGYGLDKISESFDITSSPTAETISRIANKYERSLDAFGEIIDPNDIPSLLPTSALGQIQNYINNHAKYFDDNIKSFIGKVGETEVSNSLKLKNLFEKYPKENQWGYDLLVDKDWLDKRIGIDNIECDGLLQIKTVNSKQAIYDHFDKYISKGYDIPVGAPDHVVSQLSDHEYAGYLIPFSEICDKDYDQIVNQTMEHIHELSAGHFGNVVDIGLDVPELGDSVGAISDSFIKFPIFAVGIRLAISSYRNYHEVVDNQKKVIKAIGSVAADTAYGGSKTLVGSSASIIVSKAANTAIISMGIDKDGIKGLTRDSFDGMKDSLSDGFDLSDIWDNKNDLLPLALTIGAVVAAGHYARKGFDFVFGGISKKIFQFRTRKLREIHGQLVKAVENYGAYYKKIENKYKKEIEDRVYGKHYRDIRDRKNKVNRKLGKYRKDMESDKNVELFPPPIFFFLEHAYNTLDQAFSKLDDERRFIIGEFKSVKDNYKAGEFFIKYRNIIFEGLKVNLNSTTKCNSEAIWKSGQAAVSFGLFFPQNERCTNGFIQTAYPGTKIRNLFFEKNRL